MPPFSLQRPTKIASKIDLERHHFLIDFGSRLGAMLATSSVKIGVRCGVFPLFVWVDVPIQVFCRPDPPLAKNVTRCPSMLEGFGLDVGRSLGSKSAALLAAPGVLNPTAFYVCINILLGML